MKYNVTVVRPAGFKHSSGFREVAESLSWALTQLGGECGVTENWLARDGVNIVLGAELLAATAKLPEGTIIYNLEQPSHPQMEKVRQLAKGLTVWDYSRRNVATWKELGYDVRHVPIGYTPNLTRIPSAKEKDIDVLFYGWMTPRRVKIVEDLKAAGMRVVALNGVYGGGRDNLIARSKVVLNVHHDGRELFEAVRVSNLLANSKCVVSEVSADDDEYTDLAPGMTVVPYDGLVQACHDALDVAGLIGRKGFHLFTARDYVQTVQTALSEVSAVEWRYRAGCADGDMKDFLPFIKEHAKGTCMEIGVRNGASTSAFLKGLERNGGVLLSVDVADCGKLFEGHPQWKFLQTSSQNPKLHVPPIDVLLIDGDHTREGYKADLEKYYPLVKPGGLILTHDIDPEPGKTYEEFSETVRSTWEWFGNKMSCDENFPSKGIREEYFAFAERNNLEHFELPGLCGMGVMKKAA